MKKGMKKNPLDYIDGCSDPEKLKIIAKNANQKDELEVEEAALRKLYSILPSQEPGTLEFDVWRSIHALEGTLKRERGKTVRLNRTRQKIAKQGEKVTITDLINGKISEGFVMLIERDMAEFAFEAVALRHPKQFNEDTLHHAQTRLDEATKTSFE